MVKLAFPTSLMEAELRLIVVNGEAIEIDICLYNNNINAFDYQPDYFSLDISGDRIPLYGIRNLTYISPLNLLNHTIFSRGLRFWADRDCPVL